MLLAVEVGLAVRLLLDIMASDSLLLIAGGVIGVTGKDVGLVVLAEVGALKILVESLILLITCLF